MKIINIKTIRIDGGTQSRVEINNDIVTEYAQAIQAGAEFPAVVVFNDGVHNWLADGFHRFHAHGQAGKTSIAADVQQGTARDAVLYSLGANRTHGLNRTNADKRKAVETLLKDSEWAEWSDRKIAAVCGVGHPFVAAIRKPEVAAKQQENRAASAAKKSDPVESDSTLPKVSTQTSGPQNEPEPTPKADEYTELDAAHDQITELQGQLAATIIGGASEDDKENAKALINDLQQRIKTLEATLKAVTISRDTYMNENAELRKQITRQRKEIDKATGKRTA